MTAGQKKVKDNFKKAMAIRKRTGCSLKEAFAAVYGKKTTAKKTVAKKRVAKKTVRKKIGGYASGEAIERMDALTKSTDLIMFSKSLNNIIDNLIDDGFELSEIKEYIKLRTNIIYNNL